MRPIFIFIILMSLTVAFVKLQGCIRKNYGYQNIVCVCNASYCDYIGPVTKVEPYIVSIFTSNEAGLRFAKDNVEFKQTIFDGTRLLINHKDKYQVIHGFGGAFTDATGINVMSLGNSTREHLLRAYFSQNGIQYNLCRVPIGGTDFSTHAYSYDDVDVDPVLANFKLSNEDFKYKIPLIKIAQNLTGNTLKLFSSAWTAPKWMKTNNEYASLGFLKLDMYQAWANYFIKFLDAYDEEDIQFWGITTGNEPSMGLIPFSKINSVGWTASEMSKWISENLGPTLRKSRHSSIRLIALDDQLFFLPWFMLVLFENDAVEKYVDGTGLHWYWNNLFSKERLVEMHDKFPTKFILATEASNGHRIGDRGVKLGSWSRAEKYADDIIQDLQHWVTGWVDWNMALDLEGGPTYINNNLDSPVIVNATADEFYKQPMYYAIGHFSKFITRGSVRISVNYNGNLEVIAFDRPDGATVIVILNKKSKNVPIQLVDKSKGESYLNVTPKSLTSLIYW